jgi:hypothetical protein
MNLVRTPSKKWQKEKLANFEELKRRHPKSDGIYHDKKTVLSIQMCVPNDVGYDDFFFEGEKLIYCPSNTALEANNLLEKSFRKALTFDAYIGFKTNTRWCKTNESRLRDMGIDVKEWSGKSFYLGEVYILDKDEQGRYIITATRFMPDPPIFFVYDSDTDMDNSE